MKTNRSMELPLPVWNSEEKDATSQVFEIAEEELQCPQEKPCGRIPLILPTPNWLPNQDLQGPGPPIEIKELQVISNDYRTVVSRTSPMILPLCPWNLFSNYSAASGLLVPNTDPNEFSLRFDLSSPPSGSQSSPAATPSFPTNPVTRPSTTSANSASSLSNPTSRSSQVSSTNLPPGPRAQGPGVSRQPARSELPPKVSSSVQSVNQASESDRTSSSNAPELPPVPPLIPSASLPRTYSRLPAKGQVQKKAKCSESSSLEEYFARYRPSRHTSTGTPNPSSGPAMASPPVSAAPGEPRVPNIGHKACPTLSGILTSQKCNPRPLEEAQTRSPISGKGLLPPVSGSSESNRTSAQPPKGPTIIYMAPSTPNPSSGAAPNQSESSLRNQGHQGTTKRHIPLLPTPTFVPSNSSNNAPSVHVRKQDLSKAKLHRRFSGGPPQSTPATTLKSAVAVAPPSPPTLLSDTLLFKKPYPLANVSAKQNPSSLTSSESLSRKTSNGHR